jgi:hypothetical protein
MEIETTGETAGKGFTHLYHHERPRDCEQRGAPCKYTVGLHPMVRRNVEAYHDPA